MELGDLSFELFELVLLLLAVLFQEPPSYTASQAHILLADRVLPLGMLGKEQTVRHQSRRIFLDRILQHQSRSGSCFGDRNVLGIKHALSPSELLNHVFEDAVKSRLLDGKLAMCFQDWLREFSTTAPTSMVFRQPAALRVFFLLIYSGYAVYGSTNKVQQQ